MSPGQLLNDKINIKTMILLLKVIIVLIIVYILYTIYYVDKQFTTELQKVAPVQINMRIFGIDWAHISKKHRNNTINFRSAEVIATDNKSEDLLLNESIIPILLNKTTLSTLKSLLNCNNKGLKARIYQKGEFWVLENYVSNATEVQCHESVTYTTHAGYEFLENLLPLVKRWMAPISLTIFSPGSDFYKAMKSIHYLRQCSVEAELVNKFVSFHLFFPDSHMPINISKLNNMNRVDTNCLKPAPYLEVKANTSYRSTNNLLLPINVARNIARDASTTHYLLASDIELYPSPNLVPQFLNMVALNESPLNTSTNPRVFPINLFEVSANSTIPTSKTELKRMLKTKKAIPFHKSLCHRCHVMPRAAAWIKDEETPIMRVFNVNKHYGKWEPIYIGTNADPYYDERLSWEGMMDKISQSYILCVKDYDFMVLSNAFLVHKPGIKGKKKSAKRLKLMTMQLKLCNKVFLPNSKLIFGNKPECNIRV